MILGGQHCHHRMGFMGIGSNMKHRMRVGYGSTSKTWGTTDWNVYIYIFVYSEHVLSIQLLGYQRLDPRPREVPDLTMDVTQWPMDVWPCEHVNAWATGNRQPGSSQANAHWSHKCSCHVHCMSLRSYSLTSRRWAERLWHWSVRWIFDRDLLSMESFPM